MASQTQLGYRQPPWGGGSLEENLISVGSHEKTKLRNGETTKDLFALFEALEQASLETNPTSRLFS